MKKVIMYLAVSLFLFSCDNDDNDNNSVNLPVNATTPALVSAFFTSSNGLIISDFREDGVVKTNLFSGFVFAFDANGNVTATSSSQTISGNYSVFVDDGRTELAMVFPMGTVFYELTDDWYFVSQTQNEIFFADSDDSIKFQQQ